MSSNSASTSLNNSTSLTPAMELGPEDDVPSPPFNLLLDDELKGLIDESSRKLGLSQRRFIEVAVRAFLLLLCAKNTPQPPLNSPSSFLKKLLQKKQS